MSIKLKLIKGLSYRGGKDGTLRATKDEPFCYVETLEDAQVAVASGHFKMVLEPVVKKLEKPNDTFKSINKMTKDELEAYAEKIDIDISDCKNNDERKETIKKALEENETNEENLSDDDSSKLPFQEEMEK